VYSRLIHLHSINKIWLVKPGRIDYDCECEYLVRLLLLFFIAAGI